MKEQLLENFPDEVCKDLKSVRLLRSDNYICHVMNSNAVFKTFMFHVIFDMRLFFQQYRNVERPLSSGSNLFKHFQRNYVCQIRETRLANWFLSGLGTPAKKTRRKSDIFHSWIDLCSEDKSRTWKAQLEFQ